MPREKTGAGRFSEDYPPERRRIRFSDWPERDRLAYEQARRLGDAFDLPGPAALWADETCRGRRAGYGRYLNFLHRNELLLAAEGPADRVTPDRITLYLAEMKQLLSARTIQQMLVELRQMMRALAPDGNWTWIARHPDHPTGREIRDSRKIPKTFDPKEVCSKALDLMDVISAGPMTSEMRIWYRNALIVAFQCLFSLRRRNLAEMTLGRNLIVEDDVIHLIFGPEETKTYTTIRWIVADFLKPYLRTYLEEHRPALLAGNTSDAVWVNWRHKAMGYGAIPYLFDAVGRRLVGFPISCHCFRHSVATAILTKDPRNIKIASGTLTHCSLRTVNKHYDLSGEAGSRKVWDKLRRDIVRGKGVGGS
jgi:hypothetical protein